jgi:hypothetical protein
MNLKFIARVKFPLVYWLVYRKARVSLDEVLKIFERRSATRNHPIDWAVAGFRARFYKYPAELFA